MPTSPSSSTSSTSTHSGGCQCGAIRYQIIRRRLIDAVVKDEDHHATKGVSLGALTPTPPPLFLSADFCHCRMCQKAVGNVGAALVRVPVTNLVWTRGTPSTYRSSTVVTRGFCNQCGTPLYMHEDNDNSYDIAIGSLDDPNVVEAYLQYQVGIESKVSWFETIASMPVRTTHQDRDDDEEGDDTTTNTSKNAIITLQHPDFDTESWPP